MVWGALIGAGATLLGGAMASKGQQKANEMNLKIARENRAFQERMSSTAYQRSATDLQAAGLNRILALGSPATTPSGSLAIMQNEEAAMGEAIAEAPGSAMAIRTQRQQIKLAIAQTGNVSQSEATSRAQELGIIATTKLNTAKAASAELQNSIYRDLQDAYGGKGGDKSSARKMIEWLNQTGRDLGDLLYEGVYSGKQLMESGPKNEIVIDRGKPDFSRKGGGRSFIPRTKK